MHYGEHLFRALFADWGKKVGVHLLAAGLALSVSLGHVNVAEAGVVIEQPKARKVGNQALLCMLFCMSIAPGLQMNVPL